MQKGALLRSLWLVPSPRYFAKLVNVYCSGESLAPAEAEAL